MPSFYFPPQGQLLNWQYIWKHTENKDGSHVNCTMSYNLYMWLPIGGSSGILTLRSIHSLD